MILVAMGQDQALNPGRVSLQVCKVRKHDIDAVHIFIGKTHAAVDDDHVASEFKYSHILADLTKAAKRDNFQF